MRRSPPLVGQAERNNCHQAERSSAVLPNQAGRERHAGLSKGRRAMVVGGGKMVQLAAESDDSEAEASLYSG